MKVSRKNVIQSRIFKGVLLGVGVLKKATAIRAGKKHKYIQQFFFTDKI